MSVVGGKADIIIGKADINETALRVTGGDADTVDKIGRMSLTPKQQRFVEEYLVDLNAAQAAIRAGYSEHTAKQQGYENLTKPYVQEAITKATQERSQRTVLTQDWVLSELQNVHSAAINDKNLAAANKSLELLGRHLGLFTDNLKLSGGLQISHEDALEQLK